MKDILVVDELKTPQYVFWTEPCPEGEITHFISQRGAIALQKTKTPHLSDDRALATFMAENYAYFLYPSIIPEELKSLCK